MSRPPLRRCARNTLSFIAMLLAAGVTAFHRQRGRHRIRRPRRGISGRSALFVLMMALLGGTATFGQDEGPANARPAPPPVSPVAAPQSPKRPSESATELGVPAADDATEAASAESAEVETPADSDGADDQDVEETQDAEETEPEQPAAAPLSGSPATRNGDDEAASAAARQAAQQRRSQAITQSILQLSAPDADQMSTTEKAGLVGQIAQGARVELGVLREDTAAARLTFERVQQMAKEIKHDRQTVPREVRTGQIPRLGASNRWDALQTTNAELQDLIDKAFNERLRLLANIPEAEDALEQVRSLRLSSRRSFDASLRNVLKDAEGYLGQRLEGMQELLDLYNQQAATATDAYDDSSQYTQELSAAMVAARERGLLARSASSLSLATFRAIDSSLADLPGLREAVVSRYHEEASPARTMFSYVLRLVATALLLIALIVFWMRLPAWLSAVFTRRNSDAPEPDTDGDEDLETLREHKHVEILTPVARAALLAAVAALGLQLWGLPQEWVIAALSVLGTWAGYFALVAVMRQLLAPRHSQLRVVPLDTEAAATLYRLLRALALWSAIMLPIIWVLSVLDYQHEDVLTLLSVIHVIGLAVVAGWMIYAAGGPGRLVEGTEKRSSGRLRRIVTAAVPMILGFAAAIAVLKAVGYVNLGGYLARILYLELLLVVIVVIADRQVRRHFASRDVWRKRLRGGLWTVLVLAQIWVFGLRWHHWLATLDFLKRPLFTVAENDVSILSILQGIAVILIAWLVARFLRRWLSRSARIRKRVGEGLQYTLSSLTFYLILVAGILWAMIVGGFPLNALTIFAGMAGIGLGFGLQDIIGNFVAGLILLIERPLAVGDYVEVAGTWGRVTSISLRSTVVRTKSNVHILVPNADIISTQLTNLSHHDLSLRIDVLIGVSYDADIDHVAEVLIAVAKAHEDINSFPEPAARLNDFGDSSINMLLMAWVSDPEGHKRIILELNLEIWRAFKREGIEIPFPQQDIHIRDDSAPVQIEQLPPKSFDEK